MMGRRVAMNKVPYVHYPKDKTYLVNTYFLALVPVLLFSFYKNGILLYQNDLISFIDLFIPLYFYLISVIVSLLVSWVFKEDKKEMILYGLILACSISINTNMILYPIVLFVSFSIGLTIHKKYSFNFLSLSRILLILALLVNSYSYMNVAEKIGMFHYNLFDLFLGFGVGGIASNSLFVLLISFFILISSKFYKKIIPIMASLSFACLFFLFFIFTKDSSYIEGLLNGSVYFGFVFVGAHLTVSPDTKKAMAFYGIAIGVISAILALFLPIYEVSYLSIFLVSLFIPLFNRFGYFHSQNLLFKKK